MVVTRNGFYRNRTAKLYLRHICKHKRRKHHYPYICRHREYSTKIPTPESCCSYSYITASAKPEECVQLTPRQSQQPTEHSRPCFPQLHRLVSQFCLQLQRMVGSKFSDAGGRLVFTGRRWSCTNQIPSFLVQNLCC